VKNTQCCEKIYIYDQNGNLVSGCEIDLIEKPLSCTTNEEGWCEICDLEEHAVYHYEPLCCQEFGSPPSFVCDCGTVEHYCVVDQKKKK
jgi:hypothetical protein